MRLAGLIIVLGLVLALTYFLAGDYLGITGGEAEKARLEPMKAAADVADKVGEHGKELEKRLQKMAE